MHFASCSYTNLTLNITVCILIWLLFDLNNSFIYPIRRFYRATWLRQKIQHIEMMHRKFHRHSKLEADEKIFGKRCSFYIWVSFSFSIPHHATTYCSLLTAYIIMTPTMHCIVIKWCSHCSFILTILFFFPFQFHLLHRSSV